LGIPLKFFFRGVLAQLGNFQLVRRQLFLHLRFAYLREKIQVIDASLFPEYDWEVDVVVVQSLKEYEEYARKNGDRHKQILHVEHTLAAYSPIFGLRAIDLVDQRLTIFVVDGNGLAGEVNYRENIVSLQNTFISRHRSVMLALEHLQRRFSLNVRDCYTTEQVTNFFTYLKQCFPNTIGSEYLGVNFSPGQNVKGIRHETLTDLSFLDASVDLIVSLDVLEHIPNYEKALYEMFRILRPNGCALLTAPFDPNRQEHLIRARMNDVGEVEHLFPPEYHGDPVNPAKGVLCFQTFGWQICDQLRAAGFLHAGVMPIWSLRYGVLGSHYVIYAIK